MECKIVSMNFIISILILILILYGPRITKFEFEIAVIAFLVF